MGLLVKGVNCIVRKKSRCLYFDGSPILIQKLSDHMYWKPITSPSTDYVAYVAILTQSVKWATKIYLLATVIMFILVISLVGL